MTGCVCHDDVHVVPGTLDPWPPFKYGNVSATPSPARSVAPKRSLSALEAPLNQHLRALRLEKACSVGSSLCRKRGALGPRRIDTSTHARPGMHPHTLLVSAGLRLAPRCITKLRDSYMSSPARVAATCSQIRAPNWLISQPSSQIARLPALAGTLEDGTGQAWCRVSDQERCTTTVQSPILWL